MRDTKRCHALALDLRTKTWRPDLKDQGKKSACRVTRRRCGGVQFLVPPCKLEVILAFRYPCVAHRGLQI